MHLPTSIRLIGSVVLTLGVMAGAAAPVAQSQGADDAAGEPAPVTPGSALNTQNSELPQRVILRIGRNREVAGFVELEDDDVIVVRTPKGAIESFSKLRILQTVRLVDPEPEQRGVVVLHNGQRRQGIIIEDAFEHVILDAEGIRVTLRREVVDRVMLEPSFEHRYQEFRASIEPGMFERHLILCRWLVEMRRYDLARENLLEILDQKEVFDARRMLHAVEAQLELMEHSVDREAAVRSPRAKSAPSEPPTRILTPEEVNLVRVYELDFDHPPRVKVEVDTIRRLVADYATHPLIPASQTGRNALLRADPLDIVRLMFELRARELYGEIEVLTEPPSLNHFRQRLHDTWLMGNCAACHSGPDAGRFALHRDNHRNDRVRFTNLLILERLDLDPQWPLINYEEPEMSLLLQHGLPRDMARLPHPDVPGWRPIFKRPDDSRKLDAERWIRSMMQPRPQYPIDFDPNPRKDPRQDPRQDPGRDLLEDPREEAPRAEGSEAEETPEVDRSES